MHRRTALLSVLALVFTAGCGGADSDAADDSGRPPDGEHEGFVIENVGKADAQGIEEHSFEGICVLRLVNSVDADLLKDEAGVFGWPADGIYAHRLGPDGKEGTADDDPFDDLDELDAVSWVGFFTFRSLEKYARAEGYCPRIGEEFLMPGEDDDIAAVKASSEEFIRTTYAEQRPALRDAHAKGHGCVTAEFTVDNSALEASERIGVFADNRSFPAWIRFSNGAFHLQDDLEADVRGMAVKLLGVPGEKVLEAERDAVTQDFLMINGPTMFVRNPADYVRFTELALDGNPVSYFLSLDPREWHLRELFQLLIAVRKEPGSPLTSRYWSTTPYAHGEGAAIKYSARPCGGESGERPKDAGADYLAETMAQQLTGESACFEFMIQRQTNPETMPIEDPTYEWDEDESPFVTVAKITIPPQDFQSPERQATCEHLSFTPWHTLPEHRPLGGINRVRRAVYEGIATLRHLMNEEPKVEPTALPGAAAE